MQLTHNIRLTSNSYYLFSQVIYGIKEYLTLKCKKDDNLREIKEKIYLTRLYYILKRINLHKENNVLLILKHDYSSIVFTLSYLLKYFESQEDYEKCEYIHNFLSFLQNAKHSLENLSKSF